MKQRTFRATLDNDGSTASARVGVNRFGITEIYHALVLIPWWKFFLLLVGLFVFLALFFTSINAVIGFEQFSGLNSKDSIGRFWEMFLYNAQTLTTVGGAGITPVGYTNNLILT